VRLGNKFLFIFLSFYFASVHASFDAEAFNKDGIYQYPNDESPTHFIVRHTVENTNVSKSLDKTKAKLGALSKFLAYVKEEKGIKPIENKSYENRQLYSIKENINLVGVETKKIIQQKNKTTIFLKIPIENQGKIYTSFEQKDEELVSSIIKNKFELRGVPAIYFSLEVTDRKKRDEAFKYLTSYLLNRKYLGLHSIIAGTMTGSTSQNLLSGKINDFYRVDNNKLDISSLNNQQLIELLNKYPNSKKLIRALADDFYTKKALRLSQILYMYLYVYNSENSKELIDKLKVLGNKVDFYPYTKISNHMILQEKGENAIVNWLKDKNYLISYSIITSYGHLPLKASYIDLVNSGSTIRQVNGYRNKAMHHLRKREYQKAASMFLKQIELNPFDKKSIEYLGHCFEEMDYQVAANTLYYQAYKFDFLDDKYTKRLK
jgi:hypothetical protein